MYDCINPSHPLYIQKEKEREQLAYHDGVIYVTAEAKNSSAHQSYFVRVRAFINKVPQTEVVTLSYLKSEFYDNVSDREEEYDSSETQSTVVSMLKEGADKNCSDIHFVTSESQRIVWIKHRIDGDLEEVGAVPLKQGKALLATIYNTMANESDSLYNPLKPQDGRIKVEFARLAGLSGARIATRPTDDGVIMVLRLLLSQKNQNKGMDELGYFPEQIKDLWSIAYRPCGLMIMSGATGSGKSTTIERMMSQLYDMYKGKKNFLTVEDPPEYFIHGAIQTPIICDKNDDESVRRAWAQAISNMMRLDPDVILIGEVRDEDSAMGAIRAAMTGHFVFTTLHVNDAFGCIQRLVDIGIDQTFLFDPKILSGLVNQSLTKRLCPECSVPYKGNETLVDEGLRQRIQRFTSIDGVRLAGPGCKCCKNGFVGREAVSEVVKTSAALFDVFKRQGKVAATRYWVNELGGMTKCQSMIRKINEGIIDPTVAEQDICLLNEDEITLSIDISSSKPVAAQPTACIVKHA